MLWTRMFSDNPWTPGRRQHMPRTTKSTPTPPCETRKSEPIMRASTREFIFAQIPAGLPAQAQVISFAQ